MENENQKLSSPPKMNPAKYESCHTWFLSKVNEYHFQSPFPSYASCFFRYEIAYLPIHQRSCSWKPILELPKVCLSYTICKSVDYFLSNLDRLSFSLSSLSYHVRGINVTTSNVMLIKSQESKISINCLDKTDVTWPLTSFVLPWFSNWFVFLLWS